MAITYAFAVCFAALLRSCRDIVAKAKRILGDKRHTKAAGATFAPDNLDLVKMIAMRGSTDEDMAKLFGVTLGAWKAWKEAYPSLQTAIEKGRTAADAQVLVSLYQRATGYDYVEEAAVGGRDPCVLEVKRHAPPDVGAIRYWTNNRKHDDWKDSSRLEHTGRDGGPIGVKTETRDGIIDAILNLVDPKPDGPTKPQHQPNDRTSHSTGANRNA